jgi:hypothetical protein
MPHGNTLVGEVVTSRAVDRVVISPSAERVLVNLTIDFALNALKGLDKSSPTGGGETSPRGLLDQNAARKPP